MNNVKKFLFCLSLFIFMASCLKDKDKSVNFYETDYRKGLWISIDKKDTLDFIDDSNLIRKGDFYTHEEYLYRIEDKTLYIKPLNASYETQHPILMVEKEIIIIGNMYISTGFSDNSGTFIKENEN